MEGYLDSFCELAYKEEWGDKAKKKRALKKLLKKMTEYQYGIGRRIFGKELMTEGQTWLYDTLKQEGPDPYWVQDGKKIIEKTDKCVAGGGEFHVSFQAINSKCLQDCFTKFRHEFHELNELRNAGIDV